MKFKSVIQHPESSPLVMLRSEYLEITGNHCAAKLLSVFEFWTNKLKQTGNGIREWIYKSVARLHEELMGEHGTNSIRAAINILTEKGYIEKRHNPHIKYDRTYQYKLNVDKIQEALHQLISPNREMDLPEEKDGFINTEESICPESEINNIEINIDLKTKKPTQSLGRSFKKKEELEQYVASILEIPLHQASLRMYFLAADWFSKPETRQAITEQLKEINLTPDVLILTQ